MNNENWADRRIIEYEKGRNALNEKLSTLSNSEIDKIDITLINSMINEMSEVIKWLKSGRDPYALRGVDRRSAYQKRVLYDMNLFPSLDIMPESLKPEKELSNEDKEIIADILIALSPRERECYLLHYVNLLSFEDIAKELEISKGTVQSYLERARRKIKEQVSCLTDAV